MPKSSFLNRISFFFSSFLNRILTVLRILIRKREIGFSALIYVTISQRTERTSNEIENTFNESFAGLKSTSEAQNVFNVKFYVKGHRIHQLGSLSDLAKPGQFN